MKFTKGPWKAPEGTNEIHDVDGDLVMIVKPQNKPNDEAEANLRLIAAAPDLLEACEQALKKLNTRRFIVTTNKLKNAIAKGKMS